MRNQSREMRVTVQLSGGLGNQLFQYYAGYLAAKINKRKFVIDDIRTQSSVFVSNRKQSGMPLEGIRGFLEPQGEFLKHNFVTRLLSKNNLVRNTPLLKKTMSVVDFSPNGEIGMNLAKENFLFPEKQHYEIRVRGNMQSLEIIQSAMALGAPKKLTPKRFSPYSISMIQLLQSQAPIAFHLRLKDYSFYPSQSLGKDYYQVTYNSIRKRLPLSPIWIFTDDVENAKRMVSELIPEAIERYIDPTKLSDVEAMFLMSRCAAIVTSNSTFSYWAGIISQSNLIYAPRPFFKGSGSYESFTSLDFPDFWKVVEW
jgi:Glycosyl transferase family 11